MARPVLGVAAPVRRGRSSVFASSMCVPVALDGGQESHLGTQDSGGPARRESHPSTAR